MKILYVAIDPVPDHGDYVAQAGFYKPNIERIVNLNPGMVLREYVEKT